MPHRWSAIAGLLLIASCTPAMAARRRAALPAAAQTLTIRDDFRNGQLGWESGFADYSPLSEGMELVSGIRPLPPELGTGGTGLFISGHNRSDDLFMFLAKKLTAADGIAPNQAYELSFRLTFASQAGSGCSGIGGSPGDSVYLKAGGSGEAPRIALDGGGNFRVSFDKGQQSSGGSEASVAGNIANGTPMCGEDAPFVTIVRDHRHPDAVTAGPGGALWLIVGTDSGFEGRTSLYYEAIEVTLRPLGTR